MKSIWIVQVLILVLIYACSREKDVVVQVGEQVVTRKDFLEQLHKKYPERSSFTDLPDSLKSGILDGLINNKLKVLAARDSGFDHKPEFLTAMRFQKSKELKDKYIEKEIWDKIITGKDIETYLVKSKEQMRVTQLVIGYNSARYYSRRTRQEAVELSTDIYNRAKTGEDLSELVGRYSDDQYTRDNGGDLGFRSWYQFPSAIRDTVWSMPVGKITKPIVSSIGIYLLRMDARREEPEYKWEKSESNILKAKQFYQQVYHDTIKTMIEKKVEHLKDKYEYMTLIRNVNDIAALITKKINEGSGTWKAYTEEEKERPLAKWNGGYLSLSTLVGNNGGISGTLLRKCAQMTYLRKETEKKSSDEILAFAAQKEGYSCKEEMQRYAENELLKLFDQYFIRNKIETTDDQILQYYNENTDLFMVPEQIELWVLDVGSQEEADKIIKMGKNGARIEDLAVRFSKNERLKAHKGYLGFVNENTFGELTKSAFENKGNKNIFGPIDFRGVLYLLETGAFRESTPQPYEKVKSKVKFLLEKSQFSKLDDKWIKDLKNKYIVKLNNDVYHEI